MKETYEKNGYNKANPTSPSSVHVIYGWPIWAFLNGIFYHEIRFSFFYFFNILTDGYLKDFCKSLQKLCKFAVEFLTHSNSSFDDFDDESYIMVVVFYLFYINLKT